MKLGDLLSGGTTPMWLGALAIVAAGAGVQTLRLNAAQVDVARAAKTLSDERAARAAIDAAASEDRVRASENFRKQERLDAKRAQENEHEANKQAARAAVERERAVRSADGVRELVASLDAAARARGLPSADACPAEVARSRAEAERARGLFSACVAEYRQLAEDAQGIRLTLDVALRFVAALPAE